MPQRTITLTTDFGLSDHFVGVMKGVILRIAPECTIVDITHEIRPFEITEGAFVVGQTWRWFPKKTIHVAVVDPGVGSARRPILVEAAGQYFIGPDNGLLAMVYMREKARVREIRNDKLFVQPVSATFHGRDVFAPVAARLAAGLTPARIGPIIEDYLKPAFGRPQRTGKRVWTGSILKADRFGNLITNFEASEFPDILSRPFMLAIGTKEVRTLAPTYAAASPGEPVLVHGSSGFFEVCVREASAARLLGCEAGAPAELTIW